MLFFMEDEAGALAVAHTAVDTVKEVGRGAITETKQALHIDELKTLITADTIKHCVVSGITLVLFYVIYRIVRRIIKKTAASKLSESATTTLLKSVKYTFYVLMTMYVLSLFGIKLSAIWGAAGIAGVALGFAAQTSVSNFISGLFVLTEKSIKIGDFIEIDGITGTVDAVGFLSVRIHTPDNQYVRIPSSKIISTALKNYSTFDLRRHVFEFTVDYATDLDTALEVFKTVPAQCPTVVLDKPDFAPKVMLVNLADSGITVNIAVWFNRTDLIQTRTDLCRAVIQTCRAHKINIPYNRMDITLLNNAHADC